MTLEETIKKEKLLAKENRELFGLCPVTDYGCNGYDYCKSLKNGKDKACLANAEYHQKIADWLKEYKKYKETII